MPGHGAPETPGARVARTATSVTTTKALLP